MEARALSEPADRRLRWHCRRGMQELDLLLMRWLDQRWSEASSEQRAVFARFLNLPDPEMEQYLLKRVLPADSEFAALARQIADLAVDSRAASGHP
ncbi:MAG: succinate dehydrogenase assembly factor 2 [Steroidobacteraceae bacterium]